MSRKKTLFDFTFEELDQELIARGAREIKKGGIEFHNPDWPREQKKMMARIEKMYQSASSPNPEMKGFSVQDLVKRLKELSRGQKKPDTDDNHNKGIIEDDDRLDAYELEEISRAYYNPGTVGAPDVPIILKGADYIKDIAEREKLQKIKKNLDATAVICLAKGVKIEKGYAILEVKNFKEMNNLCECERFACQPAAKTEMCTCFLVKEDVVATAAHFVNVRKIKDMRIVFGFKMENPGTLAKIPRENVYNAVELMNISYDRNGKSPDWALVKLDRKVEGQAIAKLSGDEVSTGQPVYTIGHPAGLPRKFAAGASVRDTSHEFFFKADLDIFMGNSGSPVFDMTTHEVVGIVAHGYSKDIRWADGCWVSVIYPKPGENTELSECTRIPGLRVRL